MKNNFRIVLFVLSFGIVGLLIAGIIILFLKYFPLGEKKNIDLFLIGLAVLSIYYIIKSGIEFFRRKK